MAAAVLRAWESLRQSVSAELGILAHVRQLTVFLSSTVDDLRAVRDEIYTALTSCGIRVLKSDSRGFPVESGVTSHQACVEAMEDVHVLVSLIGLRYGGATDDTGKSITWLEYDAAREVLAYPIVLIRHDMNEIAIRISRRRAELWNANSSLLDNQLDGLLREEFPDVKPVVHNLPAQQRFVDAVRKGHVDNWVHDWNGTTEDALRYIHDRLASLLSSTIAKSNRNEETANALRFLSDLFVEIGRPQSEADRDAAALRLLNFCEERRGPLFGFRKNDVHNFMVYRRIGDEMIPGPRSTHPAIRRANRRFKVGEAHVGKAILQTTPLVTPDVYQPTVWYVDPDAEQASSDRKHYVSAVSIPLPVESGTPRGVFIVTSSRSRHFVLETQAEVLTAIAVGRILGHVWLT